VLVVAVLPGVVVTAVAFAAVFGAGLLKSFKKYKKFSMIYFYFCLENTNEYKKKV
jgi:hypothetical protein